MSSRVGTGMKARIPHSSKQSIFRAVEEQTGEMTPGNLRSGTWKPAGVKMPQDSFLLALEGNTRQRPWVSTGRLGLRSVRRHHAIHSWPSPRGLELAHRSLLLTVWPLFLLRSVAHLSAVQGHPVEFSPGRSFWVKKKNGWKKVSYFWHSVLGALVAIVLWARNS